MKKNNIKNGYTLVELLAVIIILVAVGSVVTSILTSVLRTSNKSTNTEIVRRNGDSAMGQMSKMITYALKLEGVSVSGNFDDPTQYQADCVDSLPTTQYKYIRIKAFDEGVTTFACDDPGYPGSTVASQSASGSFVYLVDPSLIATCYFQCTQTSPAAPPRIDIFLDLKAKNQNIFSESQAEIPFETSVVMRNFTSR